MTQGHENFTVKKERPISRVTWITKSTMKEKVGGLPCERSAALVVPFLNRDLILFLPLCAWLLPLYFGNEALSITCRNHIMR